MFLGNWVRFMRSGHLYECFGKKGVKCEKCVKKKKMKNTMEKMKRLFRENDASENDASKK